MNNARRFLLFPLTLLAFSCANTQESKGFSSSSEISSSVISSASRQLEENYRYDSTGHWKEYVGDDHHEKVGQEEHRFGEWIAVDEASMERTCSVCGYVENHVHTYEETYRYNEDGHYRASTCGHDDEPIAAHETTKEYEVKDERLIVHHYCSVCAYHNQIDTFDPEFARKIEYTVMPNDEIQITGIGDYSSAEAVNFPREINGRTVTKLAYSNANVPQVSAKKTNVGAVYVPGSVKAIAEPISGNCDIDLFYDGTLEDWLTLEQYGDGVTCPRIHLHLRDEGGAFYLLKDLVLPQGIKKVPSMAFAFVVLDSLTCNDELEEIGLFSFVGIPSLKEIHLNAGLKSFDGYAFYQAGVRDLEIPCTNLSISSWLTLPHLRSVSVAEDADIQAGANLFAKCPRLIEFHDYRNKPSTTFTLPKTVLFAGDKKASFFDEGDFALFLGADGFVVYDYLGQDYEVHLPESLTIDGIVVDRYSLHSGFACVAILSGGKDPISDEEYEILAQDHPITTLYVPESVCLIEDGFFTNYNRLVKKMYFEMEKEAMMTLLPADLGSFQHKPEIYYLDNEEFVPLSISVPT